MLAALLAVFVVAQTDVFVPPVPKGIIGEGTPHYAKKPIPFPSEKTHWIRVRSRHFDIISSASERATRQTAAQLETLSAALTTSAPRTRVLIFSKRRESQPYFDLLFNRDGATAAGAFVGQRRGGTMIIDGGTMWGVNRTPLHELIHDLLTTTGRRPPLWLEEGLAEYYSNADARAGKLTVGYPIRAHNQLLRRGPLMPMRTVINVQRESEVAGFTLFYAQSWAAVDWLMRLNRAAFDDFLRDLEEGRTLEDALMLRYGRKVEDLDRAMIRTGGIGTATIDVSQADVTMTVEPLSRASILYELGDFLGGIEGAEPDANRHFLGALEADPHHARSLAAVGRFDEAIAADPNDAELYLAHAEHLLGNSLGPFAAMFLPAADDPEKFRKARALAMKALELKPDDPRALGMIGSSYIVEADRTPGIVALERSGSTRSDFMLHLYAFYLKAGERTKADQLFETRFARARDPQLAFAAKATLLSHELDHANQLARQYKIEEAATIVRRLAAETPDARAREYLEREAVRLEAVAETNRHIEMYNAAVSALNRGQKQAAKKQVQELLAVVKDQELLESVKALAKRLR